MEPLSRRELLVRGGRLAALAGVGTEAVWLAGCGGSTASISPSQWRQLASRIRGTVLLRGAPGYATAAVPYNHAFSSVRPMGIARCAVAEDAAAALSWAREHRIPLTVMSGGHSYAGYSTNTSFVIDMADMKSVQFDPSTGVATIGVGVRNHQVIEALPQHQVGLPNGRCPDVGVGGFVLGGGFGFTTRSLGISCDRLIETQVATASGELLTCNRNENADLFWACRGGAGGNFGINTYYKMQTHPLPAQVSVFALQWEWSRAPVVLEAFQRLMVKDAPRELGCVFGVGIAGDQRPAPVAGAVGEYLGPARELRDLLAPVLRIPGRTVNVIRQLSLGDALRYLADNVPYGRYAAKSSYVREPLPAAGLAAVVEMGDRWPGSSNPGGGSVSIFCLGGAANDVAADATAYVHRTAQFLIQYETTWLSSDSGTVVTAGRQWLEQSYAALAPFVLPESYQNWPDPALADWQRAYYGTNLERLVAVKRRYDPGNLFHYAQSIPV